MREVLAGTPARRGAPVERLLDSLGSVPVVPARDHRAAAEIYRDVRRTGRTVHKLNDCLIAAVALRTGATHVHKDADFEVIAEMFALDQLRLR